MVCIAPKIEMREMYETISQHDRSNIHEHITTRLYYVFYLESFIFQDAATPNRDHGKRRRRRTAKAR